MRLARGWLRYAAAAFVVLGLGYSALRLAVRSDGGQPQEVATFRAEVDLTIGSLGEPLTSFGRIDNLAALDDGGIIVVDGQVPAVKQFSADGSYIRSFGGAGQGPGEFVSPAYVGFRGDTVWITDSGQRRVVFYDRDGTYVRTVSINTPNLRPFRLSMPRGVAGQDRFPAPLQLPALVSDEPLPDRLPILAVDEGGVILDTLAWQSTQNSRFVAAHPERPWNGLVARQPFHKGTHWAVLPHDAGLVVAEEIDDPGPSVRVARIDSHGDTVWSGQTAFQPTTLTEDRLRPIRDGLVERVLNARGPGAGTLARAREMVDEALFVPENMPTITGMVAVDDEVVWIRRESPAEGEPQRWTRFERGHPVHHLLVPANVRVRAATREAVWGILLDDLDAAYVVRLRGEPAA